MLRTKKGHRQRRKPTGIESLESRLLLAGTPASVLLALPAASDSIGVRFQSSVTVGTQLVLTGARGTEPESLYVADGSGGGAKLFTASTISGNAQFSITALTPFQGKAYFFANSISGGQAADGLYVSDGTVAGTQPVKLIRLGTSNVLPPSTFIVDGRLYFVWTEGANSQLWSSDGTTAGTFPVPPGTVPLTSPSNRSDSVFPGSSITAFGKTFTAQSGADGLYVTRIDGASSTTIDYLATRQHDWGTGDIFVDVFQDRLVAQGRLSNGAPVLWSVDPHLIPASIQGRAFKDDNQNGIHEGFERGLSGTLYLDLNNSGSLDASDLSQTLGSAAYAFNGIPADTYTVRIALSGADAGATLHTPATGTHVVTLGEGETRDAVQFFTRPSGTTMIWGRVYNDLDADGVHDAGEPGVSAQQVYVDINGNGLLETSTEPRVNSSSDGTYGLVVAGSGSYVVRRQDKTGWRQTQPAARGGVTAVAVTGQAIEASPIGVTSAAPATISGVIWNDVNANGVRDAADTLASGVRVDLLNVATNTTTNTTTNGSGVYSFANLIGEAPHQLTVTLPTGRSLTAANVGTDDAIDSDVNQQSTVLAVAPLPGQVTSVDAGLITRTTVGGVVYRDIDDNGTQDLGEVGMGYVGVYLDLNANDSADPGEPVSTTDINGAFSFFVSPGQYRLGVTAPTGLMTTTPPAARTTTVALGGTATLSVALTTTYPSRHANPSGPESILNQTIAGGQTTPAIDVDGAGNLLAVWLSEAFDTRPIQLIGRRFTGDGVPLGDEWVLTTIATLPAGRPSVAVYAGGAFVVAWRAGTQIWSQSFAADGTALAAAQPASQTPGTKSQPVVALNPMGGFVVAWSGQVVGDSSGVAARQFTDAGTPVGDEFRVNDYTTNSQSLAGVAYDSTGRLVVNYTSAGQDHPSIDNGVVARWFDAGGSPEAPSIVINQTTAGSQVAAGVATNADRRTLQVWISSGNVFGRLYEPNGAPAGDEFRIDTSSSAAVTSMSSVVASGDRSFLCTWVAQNQDGSSNGVYGRLIGPDGVVQGREFRINTTTSGSQQWPAAVPLASGSYFVAWSGPDSSFDGVFGQRILTFTGPSAVTGVVWDDADADGLRDAGETGLAGVSVELRAANGSIVDAATTDSAGRYRFASLRPGDGYRVLFGNLAQRVRSPINVGGDDTIDSDADVATGYSPFFTAPLAGSTVIGIDAGLMVGGRIHGTVFHDGDLNAVRSVSEPGLDMWSVFLDANANGLLDTGETSITTSSTGAYSFAALDPGTYDVVVIPLARWAQTSPPSSLRVTTTYGRVDVVNVGMRPTANGDVFTAASGPELSVPATIAGDQFSARVASDLAGNSVVVWSNGTSILGRRHSVGGAPIGGEFTISATGASAAVGMADNGRFIVAWQADNDIHAQRFAADGSPAGVPFRVNSTTTGTQQFADLAVEGDGDFIIVWQSAGQDGSGEGAYAQRYSADGSPLGGEFRAATTATGNQTRPQVGVSGSGSFVIAYHSDHSGSTNYTYAQMYDAAGSAFGTEFRVNPHGGTTIDGLDVSMNGSGEFAIVYRGNITQTTIFARRYNAAGEAQGNSIIVNSTYLGDLRFPRVDLGEDGRFLVAWTMDGETVEASSAGVRAQMFDGSGLKVGDEFRVNTQLTGSQYDPSVALKPSGAVITWTSAGQDGSGTGVYAQHYVTFGSPATVAGTAFVDSNANGLQDSGEPGRDGVTVRLLNQFDFPVATGVTAGGGHYSFSGIQPGAPYRVAFTAPPATGFSPADIGTNDAIDSDVDLNTGLTQWFTLPAGALDSTRDAGIIPLATISGVMFNDADIDGVRDAGELPLAGWSVFLDADNDAQFDAGERTAVSAADGTYLFADLRPGPYRVEVVPQLRWDPTTPITVRMPSLSSGQSYVLSLGAVPTAAPVLVAPAGPEMPGDPAFRWENGFRGDAMAADSAGNYVVVSSIHVSGGDHYDIIGRRFDSGGNPLGPVTTLNLVTAGSQLDPYIAMNPTGRFVVVWQGSPDGTLATDVYARVFDSNGQPVTGDILVNQLTAGRQAAPAVAIEPDGDFIVAYEGVGANIYARRFAADGTARANEFVVNVTTSGNQLRPDVAVNASGETYVIWHSESSGTASFVYGRRFNAAHVGGAEVRVSEQDATDEFGGSVAMNAGGEVAVVWQGPSVNGWTVNLRRFDGADVAQGAIHAANTVPGGTSPDVALGDDGRVIVAWQQPDDDGLGVYVRRFTGSGIPTGNPVRVNTLTYNEQSSVTVAAIGGGSDLVHWYGFFGTSRVQRFDPVAVSPSATAGGFVWTDDAADGLFDAGDSPGSGIRVDLVDQFSVVVATQWTGMNGEFSFANLVPGATYTLRYALPAQRRATLPDQGTDDARDSDASVASASTLFVAPANGRVDLSYGLGLVTVSPPPPLVSIVSWQIAATHGSAGEAALVVPDDGSFVEPRVSGVRTLLVTFDAPINPASLTAAGVGVWGNDANNQPVNLSAITPTFSMRGGDTVAVITFNQPLPDYARYLIRLTGVTGTNGVAVAGDNDRILTALLGDATGDRRTNNTDVGAVTSLRGINPINPATVNEVRSDMTNDGRINNSDVGGASSVRGKDARFIADPVPTGGGTLALSGTGSDPAVSRSRSGGQTADVMLVTKVMGVPTGLTAGPGRTKFDDISYAATVVNLI